MLKRTTCAISFCLLLSWPLLELHLSEPQNCSSTLVHTELLLLFEAQHGEGLLKKQ